MMRLCLIVSLSRTKALRSGWISVFLHNRPRSTSADFYDGTYYNNYQNCKCNTNRALQDHEHFKIPDHREYTKMMHFIRK